MLKNLANKYNDTLENVQWVADIYKLDNIKAQIYEIVSRQWDIETMEAVKLMKKELLAILASNDKIEKKKDEKNNF